jgi:single-strand DNA-binding protein
MALSLNQVTLGGNLTRDPEVRFFADEKAVCNFTIASNRKYKGSDGTSKEEVTFVDVECWGRTAEIVGQYLVKGSAAIIIGRLKMDSWEDKTTQAKRTKLKILANDVQFLSSPRADGDNESAPRSRAALGSPAPSPVLPDDEPPF